MKRLIISAHGIRTFGGWQERLERLLSDEDTNRELTVINYKYGYFSVVAFLIPVTRWIVVRRFRSYLGAVVRSENWDRIDLVGHSFGTHLIAWALYGLAGGDRPQVNTILFAGSVLKQNFPWDELLGSSVQRVMNDCGIKDDVLIFNRLLVWFTGAAGLLGFNGGTGRSLRNRFFDYGHSGYFLTAGRPDDSFMRQYWVPLLLTSAEPELVDVRHGGALAGIRLTLLNSATPIKILVYGVLIGLILNHEHTLRLQAERQRETESHLLADRANQATNVGDAEKGMLLALSALPDARDHVSRPYVPDAEAALYTAVQRPHEVVILSGHKGSVTTAALSADGQRVVTGSDDKTVRVWSAATGKELIPPLPHADRVRSATFSPDGNRVLTVSGFNAYVWNAQTGERIAVLSHPNGVLESAAFSPDGKRVVTASWDNTARIWQAETGNLNGSLVGHRNKVKSAVFSPDGLRVVTASSDGTARVWNADTGAPVTGSLNHSGEVESAAFSADGQRVVTASGDKTARVWNAETGEELAVLPDNEGSVTIAVFSGDGRRVLTASSNNKTRLWDIADPKRPAQLYVFEGGAYGAAFSSNGRRVLTVSWTDKAVHIWDVETGKTLGILAGHGDTVTVATFGPDVDGRRVLTASKDTTARIWDVAPDEARVHLSGHGAQVERASFRPDGQRVVTASADRTARIWNVDTGEKIISLEHKGPVKSAAYSPNGQRVVTASERSARLWDAETGNELTPPFEYEADVLDAAFSPDGRRIVASFQDGTALIWDVETRKRLALRGHKGAVVGAVFSPDGRRVVTASEDKTARLWNAATGSEMISPLLHKESVKRAKFSPDGQRVLTVSGFKVQLWDVSGFEVQLWKRATERAVITAHGANLMDAAFSLDGRRVVTTSFDHTARLWDAETGKELAIVARHGNWVSSAEFSPNGHFIITASGDQTAGIWPIFPNTQDLVDHAKQIVPRCLTREQREEALLDPAPPAWCIMGTDGTTTAIGRWPKVLRLLMGAVYKTEPDTSDWKPKWPYLAVEWKQWLADEQAGKDPLLPDDRQAR